MVGLERGLVEVKILALSRFRFLSTFWSTLQISWYKCSVCFVRSPGARVSLLAAGLPIAGQLFSDVAARKSGAQKQGKALTLKSGPTPNGNSPAGVAV